MTLRIIASVLSTVFLAMTLVACGTGVASTPEVGEKQTSAPLPVRITQPRLVEMFAKYHTTSTIDSDADAPIPARVEGELVEILVEEGDRVQKGQILARLDGERLRIQVQQARANLEKTTREHERYLSLHARGLVSTAALDGMQFDVEALRANYELKQLNYDYTTIRAPISGVVSAREVKIGQHINVGETTFRVTDPAELVAYLQIPQSELSRISVGHVASIQVDAMPTDKFEAIIARISPTIDVSTGTFRATAFIDNESGLLAPGMFGRFEIAYEKHTDALVIPVAAILEEDNVAVVYVVEDGEAVRRTITTGITDGGQIEVLSGLTGNEKIIVTGQQSLRDGSKVLASLSTPFTG